MRRNSRHAQRRKKPLESAVKSVETAERETVEYSITITRQRGGNLRLREVHKCTKREVINKRTGMMISSSSMAEITSTKTARAVAKKLNLSYQKFPTRYQLHTDDQFNVQYGFRERPRKAEYLPPEQLKKLAKKLSLAIIRKPKKK